MNELSKSFQSWVPEWLIRATLFSCLMPSMMLFFLPGINLQATAGFYGCQPNDAQFLIVLFYARFVGSYILERRFFRFFPIKTYYILFHALQMFNCILMYGITDVTWVFPLRFIQGMLFASAVNLSMSMIFSRMESSKAKVSGYSVFFGLLLVSSPFNNLIFSSFLDDINFQMLYAFAAFSFIPGLILIVFLMKNVRHERPYPLRAIDWGSFIFFSAIFVSIGYAAVFGQENYWFTSFRISMCFTIALVAFLLFKWRQKHLKRVYLHLDVFKSKRYWIGITVLFVLYIERFSIQLTQQHFTSVFGLDPEHLSYWNVVNIVGIIIGVSIAARWTLRNVPIKYIWICGFSSLLLFHSMMFYRFENYGNRQVFWIPLIAHGVGVGLLMVPTILFVISTVKEHFSISAAAFCLGIRFLGFVSSIAIINYFELGHKSEHFQVFRDHLTADNPVVRQQLALRSQVFSDRGMMANVQKASVKNLYQTVVKQTQIRSNMDYYEYMMITSGGMILFVLLAPALKNRYEKWREMKVAPV